MAEATTTPVTWNPFADMARINAKLDLIIALCGSINNKAAAIQQALADHAELGKAISGLRTDTAGLQAAMDSQAPVVP